MQVMDRFHVQGVRPLDLFPFMSQEECLVTLEAWRARGLGDAAAFYALDGVWSALWISFFAAIFHRALVYRPALGQARLWVGRLLMSTWLVDFSENATIVALVHRSPHVSDGLFWASRGLTAAKWAAILTFWMLLINGVLRRAPRPGTPQGGRTMTRRPYWFSAGVALVITAADALVIVGIEEKSRSLLAAGYFGSLLFPLLAVGYWAVRGEFGEGQPRLAAAFFGVGAYLVALSTLIQGSTAIVESFRLHGAELSLAVGPVLEVTFAWFKAPLYVLGLALTLIETALFVALVWRARGSVVPRWALLGNRVSLVLVCAAAALLVPQAKVYLQLLSPNLSHVGFFVLLALAPRSAAA